MTVENDETKVRILLEAIGRAYADGEMPCQPEWFSPLVVDDELKDELASHRRRLNGVLSLAESYLSAEGDFAYARLEDDESDGGSARAVADCARQADAARTLLASALSAMCCEDAEFVIRGGQDELLGWIAAMSEVREETLA